MKKVLFLFVLMLIALPVTNVFAEIKPIQQWNTGLMNNTNIIESNNIHSSLKDDNITTAISQSVDATGTVTFKTPQSITHLQMYLTGNEPAQVNKIVFYNSSNQIIHTYSSPLSIIDNPYILELNLTDVKKVVVNARKLNELEFYNFEPLPKLPVENLKETHTYNSVNLSWDNPTIPEFDGLIIKQNGVEVSQLAKNSSSYTINGLLPESSYTFEVISKYSDGNVSPSQSITVLTDVLPVDTTAPTNVTNVSVVKTHESANFLFVLPVDTDFSHLEIYRDGNLVVSELKDTTFHDYGLIANTSYVYKIVSVDIDGNKSTGYVQTVLTDIENDSLAPVSPKNVNGINANSGGRVSWSRNAESDISGYNLYVNGVKYNTSLILASNYTINGLENGTSYAITVSAVDTSGNESGQSSPVTLNPSESEMPIFSSKFDLKDVADGTNNWFMSLWPILAFSVGITLAFIVARRVKLLFFA